LSRHRASADLEPAEPFDVSPLRDEDMDELKKVFVASFAGHQPFASLDADARARAADQCLEKTRAGADGPWLRQASFVARAHKDQSLAGAILITLMPDGDAHEYDSYYWNEPAPGDLIETRGGRPHLTWVFVRPWLAGQGAGTALLHAAVQVLSDLSYRELFSTFLLGNHASAMWHWRHGFELLSHPYSVRRMRREIRGKGVKE
jgi:hypothetical protein